MRSAFLHCASWLIQWHEGPAEAVAAAWAATEADPLHRQARVLHASHGAASLRETVQVASLHAGERPADVALRLHRLRREGEQGWPAEPMELWQALGAPSLLSGPEGDGLLARRTLMMLASDDNEAVEMLRAVSQQCGVRLAYLRLAGSDLRRADVGAAYADLPVSLSVVTRVFALSRSALEQRLVCQGGCESQQVVVLVGPHGRRTQELLHDLGQALRVAVVHPSLLLLARSSTDARAALAQLPPASRPHVRVQICANRQADRQAVLGLAHGDAESPFFDAFTAAMPAERPALARPAQLAPAAG